MSDKSKATSEYASSKVHDSYSRNDLAFVNETVPYVWWTMSTRNAYPQHRQKATSAKKATDKLRRDEIPSSDKVPVSVTLDRSPVANDSVGSAKPQPAVPMLSTQCEALNRQPATAMRTI